MNKFVIVLLSLALVPVIGRGAVGDTFDAPVTYATAGGASSVNFYFQVTGENGTAGTGNTVKIIQRNSSTSTLSGSVNATSMSIPSTVTRTAADGTVYTYNVTEIGKEAFAKTNTLTTTILELPSTLEKIELNGFGQTMISKFQVNGGNVNFSTDDNRVLYNYDKTVLVRFPQANKSLTSFAVPATVVTLGDYAFYYSTYLTNVTMGDNVLTIGSYCFSNCSAITNMQLSQKLTTIKEYAFYSCSGIKTLTLAPVLTTIGISAFRLCTSLESINLPEGIKRIESETFRECRALKAIIFPKGLTYIGRYAFYNNYSLTELQLPPKVELDQGSFISCTGLTSIVLPQETNFNALGAQFSSCSNLHTAYALMTTITRINNNPFKGCAADFKLCVPLGTELRYASISGWSSVSDRRTIINIGKPTGKTFAYGENIDLSKTMVVSADYKEIVAPDDAQKLRAYTATAVSDPATNKMKVTGLLVSGIMPASTSTNKAGLILYGSQDVLYVLKPTTEAATVDISNNMLQGVLKNDLDMSTKTGSRYFIYSGGTFYVSDGGKFSTTAPQSSVSSFLSNYTYSSGYAYKCYLDCGAPVHARYLSFSPVDEESTTGVENTFLGTDVQNNLSDNYYYSLDGARVMQPTKKGIYIHQGKKVIIK